MAFKRDDAVNKDCTDVDVAPKKIWSRDACALALVGLWRIHHRQVWVRLKHAVHHRSAGATTTIQLTGKDTQIKIPEKKSQHRTQNQDRSHTGVGATCIMDACGMVGVKQRSPLDSSVAGPVR